jgi:antitoxin component YwqK of YwqJK toxin-antitoxin module
MVFALGTYTHAQRQIKKVHYLDKFPVAYEKWDSSAYVFADSVVNCDWQVFYDVSFKIKMADFYLKGDTIYQINYYRNGNKKSDLRCVDTHDTRYHAQWCENGHLIIERKDFYDRLQTFTFYYCSGQKYQEYLIYRGMDAWGTMRCWHENGQLAWETVYPEFDYVSYNSGLLKNQKISEVFWDSTGVETKRITY